MAAAILAASVSADGTPAAVYLAERETWPAAAGPLPASVRWLPPGRRDAPWARRTAGAKRCCRWRWTALPRWDRRPTGRPSATCPGLEPAPSLVPAVPWLTLYDLTGAGPIQTRGRGAPLAQRLFVEILTVVPRAWCCPAIRRRWPAA